MSRRKEGRNLKSETQQEEKKVAEITFEPPRIIEVLDIEARAGICNSPPTFGKDITCDTPGS